MTKAPLLCLLALMATLAWAAPGAARADCTDLAALTELPPAAGSIDQIQRGLRSALRDPSRYLRDGKLGPYTKQALVRLCRAVPLGLGRDSVAGTLELAADYGALARSDAHWQPRAVAPALAARLGAIPETGANRLALQLAGPPALAISALEDWQKGAACAGLSEAALSAEARAGLAALTAVGAWPDTDALCTGLTPVPNALGDQAVAAALAAYGRIEAGLPGAVARLVSPGFSDWLVAGQATRVPRLMGSDAAAVALIAEYRPSLSPATQADETVEADEPASCAEPVSRTVLDYTAFDAADYQTLIAPVDVKTALAGLDGKTFASAEDLGAAIDAALGGQLTRCALDEIRALVTGPSHLGLRFGLDPAAAANMALNTDLVAASAAVAPLVGLSTPVRKTLETAAEAAIRKAVRAEFEAEIEVAADTLAGAAEEIVPGLDTRPEGVPEFPELPVGTPLGVTDATDSAVQAAVKDADFQQALLNADYAPAPNAEVLKGDVRRLLNPIAARKVEEIVRTAMTEVEAAIDATWLMTPDLTAAILGLDAVAAAQSVDIPEATALALEQLVGLTYPNQRLFAAAVDAVPPPVPYGQFEAVKRQARQAAFRTVTRAEAQAARSAEALALPGCGCVEPRLDHAEVYAFYPFWMLPRTPAAPKTAEADGAPPAPDPLNQVDFGLVSRIALYGYEIAYGAGSRQADFPDESDWSAMRRDFIQAAHRHRARADLAITLTGWQDWTDFQIETAVQQILRFSAPFPRIADNTFKALAEGYPTIFDAPRPDGVTLIFRGYSGGKDNDPAAGRLQQIVSRSYEGLAARGQSVNLGLDLDLIGSGIDTPLMNDLRAILVPPTPVAEPDDPDDGAESAASAARGPEPPVERILIFMERPTSDAKKTLRARLEHGDFRGPERTEVLRRIVPVLPPTGHREVERQPRSDLDPNDHPEDFSQFRDDLVYFQDNFGGIGFWPAPDPTTGESQTLRRIFNELWIEPVLPGFLASLSVLCAWICPHRAVLLTGAALIALATAGLVWRSFYSGVADRLAFRWKLAWIGVALVILILTALTVCDPEAVVAPTGLAATLLGLALLIGFTAYQRARNGPKP
ncbi:hypothetical protein [Rhodovulum kholense]|uniref:Peptidoglycan binding protein n=1 Tax=Rhodovulum kholense TaxID=453584 RepID=A0A8E2VQE5_9RHOB|nr:hypothetical protein [Rhodovulum kholense]PTW52194.1 hypothetical protein C8N38_101499 [Rhodovulum kholense]